MLLWLSHPVGPRHIPLWHGLVGFLVPFVVMGLISFVIFHFHKCKLCRCVFFGRKKRFCSPRCEFRYYFQNDFRWAGCPARAYQYAKEMTE